VRSAAVLFVVGACAQPAEDHRDAFVIGVLADDNAIWGRREPALVRAKLAKMQRDPYLWLRGTNLVYWRDATTPGTARTSAFGSVPSSRVLLVGDPHPENIGTFRLPSGEYAIEFNDLDAVGYGPYQLDVRRLAVGMIIAAQAEGADAEALAREVAAGYAARIAAGATGVIGRGAHPFLDELIDDAIRDGDDDETLNEIAPILDGRRVMRFGDLEAVAADGVIENRMLPLGADERVAVDRALGDVDVVGIGRRIGTGVASYPALRYYVVLADDTFLEMKEQREGLLLRFVPQYDSSEWESPAARIVDAQRRLHAQRDSDPLLRSADIGAFSIRIRDRADYQRGVDFEDITPLSVMEQRTLARVFGELLARAHGNTTTLDGDRGAAVIAPLLAGREDAFVAEIASDALADHAQLVADYARSIDRDLAKLVLPRSEE